MSHPGARLRSRFLIQQGLWPVLLHVPGLRHFKGGNFCHVQHIRDLYPAHTCHFHTRFETRVMVHAEVSHGVRGNIVNKNKAGEQDHSHGTR